MDNLRLAHHNARKDKSHYQAVKKTDQNLEERLKEIQDMLINHTYKPGMYRTSWRFDKGKWRILYKLPYHPDRVIQWAVMQVIEPCFQRVFLPFVCASLPNRGIHYACDLIDKYFKEDPVNTQFYLQIDIKKFYPNINRSILRNLLRKLFKDKELLEFFDKLIDGFDYTNIEHLNLADEQKELYCNPARGVPIGSYISQYFANFYLAYFDHWLKEECKCKYIIRYMDDIVIFSNNQEELLELIPHIKTYLYDNLSLEIKNTYILRSSAEGIELLGYIHYPTYRLVSKNGIIRAKVLFHKISQQNYVTEYQWHSLISRLGWLVWANTYNFISSYILTIFPLVDAYYSGAHRFNILQIYLKNYHKHHAYNKRRAHI